MAKIAGVQHDIKIGDVDGNLMRMEQWYKEARSNKAEIVVFPECAVTGYCFDSLEEARKYAEAIPGNTTNRMQGFCAEFGGYIAAGMLENAPCGGVYNALVLIGQEGIVGSYRKIHLPYLGVDRFSTFGDAEFDVNEVGDIKVGLNICYDSSFPESARVLSLLGAELIILSTNWPPSALCVAEYVVRTRALENRVYYIAVNRVGVENGNEFIGTSSICAPNGDVIALAGKDEETIIYADIDPAVARQKLRVRSHEHMVDRIADRRPEMYAGVVEEHTLKRPGR
jgi:predicted amidohydrolase